MNSETLVVHKKGKTVNEMSRGSSVSFNFYFYFTHFYVSLFHTVDSTLYLSTCNDEYIMAFCPEFLHMSACPLS